ncbi:MAG: hypothetical protein DRP42_06255 [Tenericutes bacterium]|nr:MAG: hypothetical protein DRP42_06255 [Mycoplasmatota bacterium]
MKKESAAARSKTKLAGEVKAEVTALFEAALDYAQVAVPEERQFKALRSRILRSGNDCIRNLTSKLDQYNIDYKVVAEDLIIKKEN